MDFLDVQAREFQVGVCFMAMIPVLTLCVLVALFAIMIPAGITTKCATDSQRVNIGSILIIIMFQTVSFVRYSTHSIL